LGLHFHKRCGKYDSCLWYNKPGPAPKNFERKFEAVDEEKDNDPKHKAHKVRSWLLYNFSKVLELPLQSPDLNRIANLCSELDRPVDKRPISSISAFRERLQEECAKIGPEFTNKIIANMPKQCLIP